MRKTRRLPFSSLAKASYRLCFRTAAAARPAAVKRSETKPPGEVAEHETDDEGHRRQQPADRGGAKRHPARLADPQTADHVGQFVGTMNICPLTLGLLD
jgi:hypothetical protein